MKTEVPVRAQEENHLEDDRIILLNSEIYLISSFFEQSYNLKNTLIF